MASYNELGKTGDDGITRDSQGNEVPTGLDEQSKAEFQRLLDGPLVRTMPSERDAFLAAGGTLQEHEYTIEDSTPSGGREDIEAQEGKAKPAPVKSGTKAEDK